MITLETKEAILAANDLKLRASISRDILGFIKARENNPDLTANPGGRYFVAGIDLIDGVAEADEVFTIQTHVLGELNISCKGKPDILYCYEAVAKITAKYELDSINPKFLIFDIVTADVKKGSLPDIDSTRLERRFKKMKVTTKLGEVKFRVNIKNTTTTELERILNSMKKNSLARPDFANYVAKEMAKELLKFQSEEEAIAHFSEKGIADLKGGAHFELLEWKKSGPR